MAGTWIVTGGNTGLGLECVRELAKDKTRTVVIACRDPGKGEAVAQPMRQAGSDVRVIALDLADLDSVRGFPDRLDRAALPPLAALVCNAGGQTVSEPQRSRQGYEMTFAVNHLGHYLLTRRLLERLPTNGRIVFVASGTHDPDEHSGMPEPRFVTADDVANDFEVGGVAGRRRYSTSKLCNVLCTYELARQLARSGDPRLQSLRVNAFDPGLMPGTGLARTYGPLGRWVWRNIMPALVLVMRNANTPAVSGRRLAALATGGLGESTARYFSEGREYRSSVQSHDEGNALDLWQASARMTGLATTL
jgi:NAD(P)-dependent dehydrogenase (short-subunit alcohol dehydrogenase family)